MLNEVKSLHDVYCLGTGKIFTPASTLDFLGLFMSTFSNFGALWW